MFKNKEENLSSFSHAMDQGCIKFVVKRYTTVKQIEVNWKKYPRTREKKMAWKNSLPRRKMELSFYQI